MDWFNPFFAFFVLLTEVAQHLDLPDPDFPEAHPHSDGPWLANQWRVAQQRSESGQHHLPLAIYQTVHHSVPVQSHFDEIWGMTRKTWLV